MLIYLDVPTSFCYLEALSTLQRGQDDPMNHVRDNTLFRLLPLGKEAALACISMEEGRLKINIQDELTEMENMNKVSNCIQKMFGLDDPLIYEDLSLENYSDKYLDNIIGVHGYLSVFEASVQTIIGQLISARAADSIRKRFIKMFGLSVKYGDTNYFLFPTAEKISNLSNEELKKSGMSRSKSEAVLEISKAFSRNDLGGKLKNALHTDELTKALMSFQGVGRWTSDWIALRALRQFEIIPKGDLIIKKAFSWLLDLPGLATSNDIDSVCKNWPKHGGSVAYRVMFSYIKHHRAKSK